MTRAGVPPADRRPGLRHTSCSLDLVTRFALFLPPPPPCACHSRRRLGGGAWFPCRPVCPSRSGMGLGTLLPHLWGTSVPVSIRRPVLLSWTSWTMSISPHCWWVCQGGAFCLPTAPKGRPACMRCMFPHCWCLCLHMVPSECAALRCTPCTALRWLWSWLEPANVAPMPVCVNAGGHTRKYGQRCKW